MKAMQSYLKKIKKIYLFLIIVTLSIPAFAQETNPGLKGNRGNIESKQSPESTKAQKAVKAPKPQKGDLKKNQEELTQLQLMARVYRDQGLEYQRTGDKETALTYYQKAAEFDPLYSVAYNDLGVIYEANGLIDKAEENYLRAINIDPSYLSACTNLALLYENKRDFDKAAFYWGRRAALGQPGDPWTEKAAKRLEDIKLVSSASAVIDNREQEVVDLLRDVANKKSISKKNNNVTVSDSFTKAKKAYEKQDYPTAVKLALDAQQLEPYNPEIQDFIDRAMLRALSR